MKKILALSLMLGTLAFAAPLSTEAAKGATAATAATPQDRMVQTRGWNRRGRRVVTTTRITRVGRFRYRETIRTTYLPNGRTRVQVISRVRLGRGYNY